MYIIIIRKICAVQAHADFSALSTLMVFHSINRVMVAHVDRNDLPVLNQQFQRDAERQIDGHRMQAIVLAFERMQPQ